MDTRQKILTAAQALALRLPAPAVATGGFDVLLPAHVRDLEAARGGAAALLVVVLPLPGPVLNQRARAELVAGLRVVDYVVIAEDQAAERLIEGLRPCAVARLEAADLRRARELREHVRHRQAS